MGLLDVITGRLPLFKRCNYLDTIEADFTRFLNPNPSDKNYHYIPHPAQNNYTDIQQSGGISGDSSEAIENRVTTTVVADGINKFQILKNASSSQEVLEISVQPTADCHLQIFEGITPLTAIRFVEQNRLWSCPGKTVLRDLLIFCQESNITLNVEVRTIAKP